MDDRTRTYSPPTLVYHGTVSELTQSQHLVIGGQVVRFAAAFANSLGPPIVPPGPGEIIQPKNTPGAITDIVNTGGGGPAANGGAPGGGAPGGATGGAGSQLPFTGLAVMGVAAVGAALASAGVALKRIVGKQPSD